MISDVVSKTTEVRHSENVMIETACFTFRFVDCPWFWGDIPGGLVGVRLEASGSPKHRITSPNLPRPMKASNV